MLRQSSFWDNSYKKAAGSALKKVIRYVTIIGYPFVCSFAGDDIIELDSTTDEIKMPPGLSQILCKRRNAVQIEQNLFKAEVAQAAAALFSK